MTQTIEQLTARVRELEEENARLHEQVDLQIPAIAFKQLTEQLAASQADAEQLREALELLNKASNIGCCLVDKALARPHDTSALDSYVAKRLHDMACDKGLLRIQVEELTRQRDLAVEALEKYATSNVRLCNLWAVEALSAIKESEAMAQGEKK